MSKPPTITRTAKFQELRLAQQEPVNLSLYLGVVTHVYVRLDMKYEYEYATTTDDALSYLKAVAMAATICETIAKVCDGFVLEVQGSTIHVGLPHIRWMAHPLSCLKLQIKAIFRPSDLNHKL